MTSAIPPPDFLAPQIPSPDIDVIRQVRIPFEAVFHGKRPAIVCLCGSTRFYDQFQSENARLTMAGHIVLSVGFFLHREDAGDYTEQDKIKLDQLHKRKIDLADSVHVINVGGYIGDS